MLEIIIKGEEMFDEDTCTFTSTKDTTLRLEHSLVSISKWEAKWNIPFLDDKPKTTEQELDYINCMSLDGPIDPIVLICLKNDDMVKIQSYIEAPMTATKLKKMKGKRSYEITTSEIIYYWMIALNIPFECQYWHLNRLITLVEVCNRKNQPPKKMSKEELMAQQARLNAERRARLKSKG